MSVSTIQKYFDLGYIGLTLELSPLAVVDTAKGEVSIKTSHKELLVHHSENEPNSPCVRILFMK